MKHLSWKLLSEEEEDIFARNADTIVYTSEEINILNLDTFHIRNIDLFNPSKIQAKWFLYRKPSYSSNFVKAIYFSSENIDEVKAYAEEMYILKIFSLFDDANSRINNHTKLIAQDKDIINSLTEYYGKDLQLC